MALGVYLIHGADEVRILDEKRAIIHRVLEAEFQAENLTELDPPANRPLELSACAMEIVSELGTLSFFAEARRVVVVNNLQDLCTAGRKAAAGRAKKPRKKKGKPARVKLTPVQGLIKFLDRDLAETNNVLIFCLVEIYEKRRTLSKASPLYRLIKEKGQAIIECKKPEVSFQFTDALFAKDLEGALRAFREIADIGRCWPRLHHVENRGEHDRS